MPNQCLKVQTRHFCFRACAHKQSLPVFSNKQTNCFSCEKPMFFSNNCSRGVRKYESLISSILSKIPFVFLKEKLPCPRAFMFSNYLSLLFGPWEELDRTSGDRDVCAFDHISQVQKVSYRVVSFPFPFFSTSDFLLPFCASELFRAFCRLGFLFSHNNFSEFFSNHSWTIPCAVAPPPTSSTCPATTSGRTRVPASRPPLTRSSQVPPPQCPT